MQVHPPTLLLAIAPEWGWLALAIGLLVLRSLYLVWRSRRRARRFSRHRSEAD